MTSENRGSIASKSHDSVDSDDMDTWDCIIDHEDDIDWDNIIATTEDDFQAGRYAFNSADYATHEEAMKAMDNFLDSIVEEVKRRVAADSALHAKS